MIGFNVHWGLACIVRLQTYQGLLPFGTSLVGLSGYKHIKVYYPLALRLLDCQATNISRFTTLWCLAWIGLSGYKHTKVYYPLGLGLDWVVRLQTYQGLLPFGAWLGLDCQATNISRFTTLWRLAWVGLSGYKHFKVYYPLAPGLGWVVKLQTYQGLLPFGTWLVGLSGYKHISLGSINVLYYLQLWIFTSSHYKVLPDMVQRGNADSKLLNSSDKELKLFYKQYCKLRNKNYLNH